MEYALEAYILVTLCTLYTCNSLFFIIHVRALKALKSESDVTFSKHLLIFSDIYSLYIKQANILFFVVIHFVSANPCVFFFNAIINQRGRILSH